MPMVVSGRAFFLNMPTEDTVSLSKDKFAILDFNAVTSLHATYHTPTKWTFTSLAKVDLNSSANILDLDLGVNLTS